MKKFVSFVVLLIAINANAQEFQGVAEYQSKTVMDFKTAEDGNESPELDEALKEQLKKAFEKSYTLHFNKTESVYEEQQKLSEPAKGNISVQVNFSGGGKQYKNLKDKVYFIESDIFGKEFLIADSLKPLEWKMESDTRKIGDYTCYKATAVIHKKAKKEEGDSAKAINLLDEDKDIVITAWYAPEIPVSHGPDRFWGLPGLILEANDGRTALLCSKLTLNPKDKYEIVRPKKGKKVTQAEFDKITEEKANEMMERDGNSTPNSSTRVIKIRQ
jgi:GLPGLI family protein